MNRNVLTPIFGMTIMAILLVWLAQMAWNAQGEGPTWSGFKEMVSSGEIAEVVIEDDLVRAKRVATGDGGAESVRVVRVRGDEGFIALLEENNVPYKAVQRSGCSDNVLPLVVLPLLLLMFFWFMMARREDGGRGAAAFGRSTAQLAPEEGTGVTFGDVAGVEEAREELQEVVQFLETPEKFTSLGGRPPKGVLLVGPPGTGKTLLARAVAGEAGVPFFSISGSAFVEMFVGVGAARVRDLFKQALEHAPCIIFIDELDAVGKSRGMGPAGNEEREQTLNQLLVEMDGFDNRKGIIVMGATNRPEILDPALLRAGRFDRQVLVDRPDLRGRKEILEVHAEKIKLDGHVDLEEIAKLTPGLAGADLANAMNEAALLAARRDATSVERQDIFEAIERVVAGLERKSRRLSPTEKRTVAYHECGHAICAAASPGADPVTKITIIPRGIAALGYTMQLPDEERHLTTKVELLNRLVILFGGRAAEELVFGDVTNGAYDDIRRATDIARRMVTEFGMSKRIGAVNYGGTQTNAFGIGMSQTGPAISPETAEEIEQEVRSILDSAHRRAIEMLVANRALLEEMSTFLIDKEVLEGEVMRGFLSRANEFDSLEDRPTAEWIPEAAEHSAAEPSRTF